MRLLIAFFLVTLFVNPLRGAAQPLVGSSFWQQSLVRIEVASKQFDYYQPWNQRSRRVQKVGIVTGDHEILTPAEYLSNETLVRIQKNGRGKWWIGKLSWVDYPANLAVVTVEDDAFWTDLKPVQLDGKMPEDGSLHLVNWNDGVLESRKATFMRFVVEESETGAINHVQFKANVDLQGAGWGEPLVADSHVVGIATDQIDNICTVTPASFIQSVMNAHRGAYRGLGYFHFYWQPAENVASLEYLGLKGTPRGVLVTRVPKRLDGVVPVLQRLDVILEIDGFRIDIQGDYDDPDYGYLMLENLSTRNKWAGDDVHLKILRGGKEMEVTYRLPKYEYTNWLVPSESFDQEPDYFMIGGLVFQTLTTDYLKVWGADWKRRAPFRLNYYASDDASKERPSLVILSQVLPDDYNIGYQEQRYLVVNKVNDRSIGRLADLLDAFKNPLGNYHVIEFKRGNELQKIVLAAGDVERTATRRILERYGISHEFQFAEQKSPAP